MKKLVRNLNRNIQITKNNQKLTYIEFREILCP